MLAWRMVALAVLVLMLLVSALLLQWRQKGLMSDAALSHGDNTSFTVFQAEVEYLRLRAAWPHPGERPEDLNELGMRYELFVSRIRLLRHSAALASLVEPKELDALLALSESFIGEADRRLVQADAASLSSAEWAALGVVLDSAAPSLRQLSMRGVALMGETYAARTAAATGYNRLAIAGTAVLGALVLILGGLAARQLQLAARRARELEDLAMALEQARGEAERASQAKTDFLANMSHEIRTPFQGIVGMLTLIGQGPLTQEQRSQLTTASGSVDHLLALLNDILDLSRLESGCVSIDAQPTSLQALLQAVATLMAPQAQHKGLTLDVQLDLELPGRVSMDAMRLRQVLFNLLSNAVKFTESGQVRLHASLDDGTRQLVFEVSDTGIGMDAATLQRLFTRYGQGDASRSRRFGGTGLGLEISRRLARLMGGDIAVSSVLGQGSRFVLTLPCTALPDAEEASHPRPTAAPPDNATALRVLIAEDNPVNCMVLQAMLEQLGHRTVIVHDGKQVVNEAAGRRFDAVLMDLHMPQQDGYAAAAAIRALPDSLAANVPIIALTADGFAETRQRCLASGMDDFLTKPVAVDALRDALRRVQGHRPAPSLTVQAPTMAL
jgi:signal transduction histidine kinase/CheY-like chemotaxis protein